MNTVNTPPAHMRATTLPQPEPIRNLADAICVPGALDHPMTLYVASTLLDRSWVPSGEKTRVAEACQRTAARFLTSTDIRKRGLPYRLYTHPAIRSLQKKKGFGTVLKKLGICSRREYDNRFPSEVYVLAAYANTIMVDRRRFDDSYLSQGAMDAVNHLLGCRITTLGRQKFSLPGRDMGTGHEADEEGHPSNWMLPGYEWRGGDYAPLSTRSAPSPIILSNNLLFRGVLSFFHKDGADRNIEAAIVSALQTDPGLFIDKSMFGPAFAITESPLISSVASDLFQQGIDLAQLGEIDLFTASLIVQACLKLALYDLAKKIQSEVARRFVLNGAQNRWLYSPASSCSMDDGVMDRIGMQLLLRFKF